MYFTWIPICANEIGRFDRTAKLSVENRVFVLIFRELCVFFFSWLIRITTYTWIYFCCFGVFYLIRIEENVCWKPVTLFFSWPIARYLHSLFGRKRFDYCIVWTLFSLSIFVTCRLTMLCSKISFPLRRRDFSFVAMRACLVVTWWRFVIIIIIIII